MDMPNERVPESASPMLEAFEPQLAMPADDMDQLHRAINERRAQQENPELLRHLRSL
ncbi:MAG: hypothetical protein JF588_20925 [Caulobacterales bacterium]|nr:hypothetical protein [Caulobacterales bacterium]